jgi:hypothetical protein
MALGSPHGYVEQVAPILKEIKTVLDTSGVVIGGQPITVQATDLDIRNLSNSTDSVTAHKGGTWALDSPADGTYIGDIKFGESLPSGSNTIGKVDVNPLDPLDTSHTTPVAVSGTSDTTIQTPSSGKKLRVWSITVTNNDTTTSQYIEFGFGTSSVTYKHRIRLRPEASFRLYFSNGWLGGLNEPFKARLSGSATSFYVTLEYTEE